MDFVFVWFMDGNNFLKFYFSKLIIIYYEKLSFFINFGIVNYLLLINYYFMEIIGF